MLKPSMLLFISILLIGCDSGSKSDSSLLDTVMGEHYFQFIPVGSDQPIGSSCFIIDTIIVIENTKEDSSVVGMSGYLQYDSDDVSGTYFFSELEDNGDVVNFVSISSWIEGNTPEADSYTIGSPEIVNEINEVNSSRDVFDMSRSEFIVDGNIFSGGTWSRKNSDSEILCSGVWNLNL